MKTTNLLAAIEHRAKEVCLSKDRFDEFVWLALDLIKDPDSYVIVTHHNKITLWPCGVSNLGMELKFFLDAYGEWCG